MSEIRIYLRAPQSPRTTNASTVMADVVASRTESEEQHICRPFINFLYKIFYTHKVLTSLHPHWILDITWVLSFSEALGKDIKRLEPKISFCGVDASVITDVLVFIHSQMG